MVVGFVFVNLWLLHGVVTRSCEGNVCVRFPLLCCPILMLTQRREDHDVMAREHFVMRVCIAFKPPA